MSDLWFHTILMSASKCIWINNTEKWNYYWTKRFHLVLQKLMFLNIHIHQWLKILMAVPLIVAKEQCWHFVDFPHCQHNSSEISYLKRISFHASTTAHSFIERPTTLRPQPTTQKEAENVYTFILPLVRLYKSELTRNHISSIRS